MENLFEILMGAEKEEEDKKEICLGIRLKIAGYETTCPVSKTCHSYKALDNEIKAIEKQLEALRDKGKKIFTETSPQKGLNLKPDMDAEQIWSVLSDLSDENLFMKGFNSLDETKRREVAEHVLTKCNIFSGKASTFSSRYRSESGLLE